MSLTLWGEYLRYGLKVEDSKVQFVPPEFMRQCLVADKYLAKGMVEALLEKERVDEAEIEHAEEVMNRHQMRASLLNKWGENEALVVCMHDEASGRCGLLVERKMPRTSRYYEGGAVVNEGLAKQVALLRKMRDGDR